MRREEFVLSFSFKFIEKKLAEQFDVKQKKTIDTNTKKLDIVSGLIRVAIIVPTTIVTCVMKLLKGSVSGLVVTVVATLS